DQNKDLNMIKKEWRKKYKTKIGLEEEKEQEELSIELSETMEESEDPLDLDFSRLKIKIENDLKIINEFEKLIEALKEKDGKIPKYRDIKVLKFFTELEKIYFDGINPKIIVFSQFKDTVRYLNERMKEWLNENPDKKRFVIFQTITGNTSKELKKKYIGRFAPVANRYKFDRNESELSFIISTDALSEGVNLQDASVVINYDLPWNPMRIVQRVGRVNRIGSSNQVLVYNFFPDKDLESLLKLLSKLKDKIENVKNLLAKEMQILSDEEDITIDTIGEVIKNTREETDINILESSSQSSDFSEFVVYGEDQETLEKLTILKVLERLGIKEDFYKVLFSKINGSKVFTIANTETLVQYYQIWDRLRDEKLMDYLISMTNGQPRLERRSAIIKLLNIEKPDLLEDFLKNSEKGVKNKLTIIHKFFEKVIFERYRSVFSAQKQAMKTEIKGLQNEILKYLSYYKKQVKSQPLDLFLKSEDKEKIRKQNIKQQKEITRLIKLYESFSLKSFEVRELKEIFAENNYDLEETKLKDIPIEKLLELLNEFFTEKMSQKSSAVFGGVRTKSDIIYKNLAWYY
ncbi:MAG: helicase-related protein, partial [Candidatus Hodarchaeota archaeon]